MKRARLIIKEVRVTKAGEIKNFQIKLPKNVIHIVAIETDVRIDTVSNCFQQKPKKTKAINQPYLFWQRRVNPVMGRLKLRSMERTNIFYEEWLHFIEFSGGIPDMSMGLFLLNPTSLNKNRMPKKVDVPKETTLIGGFYEDSIGTLAKKNVDYTIKVFVWVETDEDANGVAFDFQEEEGFRTSDKKSPGDSHCEIINKK